MNFIQQQTPRALTLTLWRTVTPGAAGGAVCGGFSHQSVARVAGVRYNTTQRCGRVDTVSKRGLARVTTIHR